MISIHSRSALLGFAFIFSVSGCSGNISPVYSLGVPVTSLVQYELITAQSLEMKLKSANILFTRVENAKCSISDTYQRNIRTCSIYKMHGKDGYLELTIYELSNSEQIEFIRKEIDIKFIQKHKRKKMLYVNFENPTAILVVTYSPIDEAVALRVKAALMKAL